MHFVWRFSLTVGGIYMPYEVKYRVTEQRPYVNINFQRWNPTSFPSVYKDHRAELPNIFNQFFNWILEKVTDIREKLTSSNQSEYLHSKADQVYIWFRTEGYKMFREFEKNLNPFSIHRSQLERVEKSISLFKQRYDYQLDYINDMKDYDQLLDWLMELPYLFKQRLTMFQILSDHRQFTRNKEFDAYFQMESGYLTKTGSSRTCLFYQINIHIFENEG